MHDEDTPVIMVPELTDAGRELLVKVRDSWQDEVADLCCDEKLEEVIHDGDTLRAYARWADARGALEAYLDRDAELTTLEPFADLFRDAMIVILEDEAD